MEKKEMEELLNSYLIDDQVIGETYNDKKYIYIFLQNQKLEEAGYRRDMAGGQGPIRIEKITKVVEQIHYLDFPTKLYKGESKRTLDTLASNITKRGYLGEAEMCRFVELVYGDDLGAVFYNFKVSKNKIRAHFKIEEIRDKFKDFLENINVKCFINNEDWLEIERILEKN